MEVARQLGGRLVAISDQALRRLDSTTTRVRMPEPKPKTFFGVELNPAAKPIFVRLPVRLREAGVGAAKLDWPVKASLHPLMNDDPGPITQEQLRSSYADTV